MDRKGNVICEMHNQVIKGARVNDPTAHGERQIIDWYLENKEKDGLPEPENCILITTLDPCVMCTGALAQVQFNRVIVIALDDYAGINWEGTDECAALDGTDCQKYVKEHFAYPEVTGGSVPQSLWSRSVGSGAVFRHYRCQRDINGLPGSLQPDGRRRSEQSVIRFGRSH